METNFYSARQRGSDNNKMLWELKAHTMLKDDDEKMWYESHS